ncbi:hypothetical protein KR018_001017 [Drosophila ironensis]|nr:hypothetical protein KR018_001017 [Drosophila ironensis]
MSRQVLLDEEIENLRRIALAMCQSLGRPRDREICKNTLDELANFNSTSSVSLKQNVHEFLIFYLKVIRWTCKNQPLGLYRRWYGQNLESAKGGQQGDEYRAWLEAGKSFMAMKTFEDGSTIIYTAVSKNTTAGWRESGLKMLKEGTIGSE